MKNIFIIHSLNGDTLEFWGKDVKQKFEDKLDVYMPKFPIRAESKYEKFDEILSKYLQSKELNEESIVICHSIGNPYFIRFCREHNFTPNNYIAVAPGAVYCYPSSRTDYIVEVKKQSYLKQEDFDSFYKIGKVIETKQHSANPNLTILKVQFKFYEKQIITNLKNIEQNKNYLFAIDGAITSSGLKIVESKISNTLSQGMIMSYKSLGIDKEGIVDCSYLSIEDEFQF